MTCVDVCKYVFLSRLKNEDAKTVVDGLREICILQANNNYPNVLVSDDGLEFKNVFMSDFCNENGIKQVFGRSYSPQSNSLAEATNNIIRQVMRVLFVKNGNNQWYNHLEEVRKSINDSSASSTEKPRSEVYMGSYKNEVLSKARKINNENANKNKIDRLNIGDIYSACFFISIG